MRDDSFNQMNLFNFNREYKKVDKTIRLIEFFSGIGSQARALQILGVPFEPTMSPKAKFGRAHLQGF